MSTRVHRVSWLAVGLALGLLVPLAAAPLAAAGQAGPAPVPHDPPAQPERRPAGAPLHLKPVRFRLREERLNEGHRLRPGALSEPVFIFAFGDSASARDGAFTGERHRNIARGDWRADFDDCPPAARLRNG